MLKIETQFDLLQRIFEKMKQDKRRGLSIYDLIDDVKLEGDDLKQLLDKLYQLVAIGLIRLSFEDGEEGRETMIWITPLGEIYLKENVKRNVA